MFVVGRSGSSGLPAARIEPSGSQAGAGEQSEYQGYRELELDTFGGDPAAASHLPILEALRARDPERARQAMQEHIRQAGERYVAQLEAKEGRQG